MFKLDNLYSGHKPYGDNPLCEGCTILEKAKPCYSVMDHDELKESPTLFLSDSLKYTLGSTSAFSKQEIKLIKDSYKEDFVTAASVKCPDVREADMNPTNMNICRSHLEATIDKVKPKLVFVCGNLAMKMLIKKSGITTKRGKSYVHTTDSGHSCTVVPIYHPYFVIIEPKYNYLFRKDIQNAYEKYILEKKSKGTFAYKVLTKAMEVEELAYSLKNSEETIAVDIETTGLNFLRDKIMTIAISSKDQTWVIPMDHKDSPFRVEGNPKQWLGLRVWSLLKLILENPKSKKVFHNAKFDLKFLINYGIRPVNVWDTKIMHHLLDENMPKGLMDLVKLYFASELENL
jgi:uracil-DNA glycosylase family 4